MYLFILPFPLFQKWLTDHKIQFDASMLRPQLLALAKQNKPDPTYVIDDVVREHGHEVLRLPPYHPDLNPIELIWSQVKNLIASRNLTYRLADLVNIANISFDEIGPNRWRSVCEHVQKVEKQYREKDIVVDIAMDSLVINLTDDSDDNDSDDSTDSEKTESASEGED